MAENIDWRQFVAPAVFMLGLLVMFWWIVIRPTQSRQKKHQDLVKALAPGDDVITVGGIYGKIVKVHDKNIDVEIAQGVTITLDRRAIRRLQEQEDF